MDYKSQYEIAVKICERFGNSAITLGRAENASSNAMRQRMLDEFSLPEFSDMEGFDKLSSELQQGVKNYLKTCKEHGVSESSGINVDPYRKEYLARGQKPPKISDFIKNEADLEKEKVTAFCEKYTNGNQDNEYYDDPEFKDFSHEARLVARRYIRDFEKNQINNLDDYYNDIEVLKSGAEGKVISLEQFYMEFPEYENAKGINNPQINAQELKLSKQISEKYESQARQAGMSKYNERMNVKLPDLKQDEQFSKLSNAAQKKIEEFLYDCYKYGMGMYQERGACAEFYEKCKGVPPKVDKYFDEQAMQIGQQKGE